MEELIPQQDFLDLSKEIDALLKGLSDSQIYRWELLVFAGRLILFAAGYAVFAVQTPVGIALGLGVMAYAYYGIGITGVHEASHKTFVKSPGGNRAWLYFFSDFWAAQSSKWWHYRHVIMHHAQTNVPGKDPPLFTYPWLDKYLYFLVTPFLTAFWLVFHSTAFLLDDARELSIYLTLAGGGWAFDIYLFHLILPWGQAALAAFVMRSLFAPVFMHLAVFNHIGLDSPQARLPWLPHQTRTTRNLRAHWFLSGMGGNAFVECHIEHHIFPSLPNHMLAKIRPVVRRYLERAGYTYTEQSYWDCLKNSLRHYDSLFTPDPGV